MSFNWKLSTMKIFIIGALLVLCLFSTLIGTVKSASAAAATSCYGGNIQFTNALVGGDGTGHAPASGSYTTSTRCNDINLRFTNLPENVYVDVCWSKQGWCRSIYYGYTFFGAGDTSWHVIATNVADYTTFTVQFIPYNYDDLFYASGYVAS